MTAFCISTTIVTAALLLFLVYALCAASARADAVSDMIREHERRQREAKVRG